MVRDSRWQEGDLPRLQTLRVGKCHTRSKLHDPWSFLCDDAHRRPFFPYRLNLANDAADIRETDDDAEQKDIYLNVSAAPPFTRIHMRLVVSSDEPFYVTLGPLCCFYRWWDRVSSASFVAYCCSLSLSYLIPLPFSFS